MLKAANKLQPLGIKNCLREEPEDMFKIITHEVFMDNNIKTVVRFVYRIQLCLDNNPLEKQTNFS